MTEADVLHEVLAALGALPDVRIFRNQVGRAVNPSSGQFVKFGLTVGASDIIGIGPRGRFLALEVKSPTGRLTPAQLTFLDVITRLGGIAGVVRSGQDALRLIQEARQ